MKPLPHICLGAQKPQTQGLPLNAQNRRKQTQNTHHYHHYHSVTLFTPELKILTASPLSPCLPVGPAGPGEPGGPGAPGAPSAPVSPRSPYRSKVSDSAKNVSEEASRDHLFPGVVRYAQRSPPSSQPPSQNRHQSLTLTPAAPSLPGGPSAPGLPWTRGHEDSLRAASCLLSHSGLKRRPVHFCPTETSGLTCPPLSFHPPSSLYTQSWSLCVSFLQDHPATPSSRAHLSSRFTRRPCQARRPHGTRRTSVSRCTRCTLLAGLTLKGCRQGP